MALNTEFEKDLEKGTTIGTESTAYHSDVDDAEHRKTEEGAVGEPDSDHGEVEKMDRGHLEDLERQQVCISTTLPVAF